MIYITEQNYTNRRGKVGTTFRVFNSKQKAEKYAERTNANLRAHKGSWVK